MLVECVSHDNIFICILGMSHKQTEKGGKFHKKRGIESRAKKKKIIIKERGEQSLHWLAP